MTETVSGAGDLHDDVLSPSAIRDPCTYYRRICETDPVRWNERHRTWIVTRFNDVACSNGHTVFSLAIVNTAEQFYPPSRHEDLGELRFARKLDPATDTHGSVRAHRGV